MAESFWWIVGMGLLMSAISLVGAVTFVLRERTFKRLIHPLVSMAAGTLLGGAFFHMLPTAIEHMGNQVTTYVWVLAGFSLFLVLEQFLHWHHCHKAPSEHRKEPLTYLILVADSVHNFIGGLGIGASFMLDIRVGLMAWTAAALHEIPQELGDYGVLVHGGWSQKQALTFNLLSSLTFLLAGISTYFMSSQLDVGFLVPFAAGNFIYIAAADLVPEIKRKEKLTDALTNFFCFIAGIGMLLAAHILFENGVG